MKDDSMARRKGSGQVYTDPEEYMKAIESNYQKFLRENYEKLTEKKKRGRPPKNKEQKSAIVYTQGNFELSFD